jgi:hypothetical protein
LHARVWEAVQLVSGCLQPIVVLFASLAGCLILCPHFPDLELAKVLLQTEVEKRRQEEEKNKLAITNARQQGVRGASMTPSALSKTFALQTVDPWFLPIDIKFNKVIYSVDDTITNEEEKKKLAHKTWTKGPARNSKFYTQDDVNEKHVQRAWVPSFGSVIDAAKKNKVHWFDGHDVFWLKRPGDDDNNAAAPDGVAQARSVAGKPDPQLIIGVHDNKASRRGRFTDDDRGKLYQYALTLLQFHQPSRVFIGESLFDGRYAQCFKIVRAGAVYEIYCSRVLDLGNEEDSSDTLLYAGFLTSPTAMGWDLSSLSPDAGDFVAHGGTSMVFGHKTEEDCVLKIFFPSMSYLCEKEAHVLITIAQTGTSPGLVRLKGESEHGVLVLTPLFPKLATKTPFNAGSFSTLIRDRDSPLRLVHRAGFFHCDIRPPNIMSTVDGKALALVDLGAARSVSETGPFKHGGIHFASDRVLREGKETNFIFETQDDLIALVRCYLLMSTGGQANKDLLGLATDTPEGLDLIRAFWAKYEAACPWVSVMMEAAKNANYERLSKLFSQRHLGSISE